MTDLALGSINNINCQREKLRQKGVILSKHLENESSVPLGERSCFLQFFYIMSYIVIPSKVKLYLPF